MKAPKSKTPKSKSKTEVLTIRVTSKLKFELELLSRFENLSFSECIVQALKDYVSMPMSPLQLEYVVGIIRIKDKETGQVSEFPDLERADLGDILWSESEYLRLIKMGFYDRNLLNKPERKMIEVIKLDERFWKSPINYPDDPQYTKDIYGVPFSLNKPIFTYIEHNWDNIKLSLEEPDIEFNFNVDIDTELENSCLDEIETLRRFIAEKDIKPAYADLIM